MKLFSKIRGTLINNVCRLGNKTFSVMKIDKVRDISSQNNVLSLFKMSGKDKRNASK